eukprot:221985-Prymnesium_polylepis.1
MGSTCSCEDLLQPAGRSGGSGASKRFQTDRAMDRASAPQAHPYAQPWYREVDHICSERLR